MRTYLLLTLWLCWSCSATKMPGSDGGNDAPDLHPIDVGEWENAGLDPDAGTVDFIRELTKASLGESADLDGDGFRELSVLNLPDGTRVWNWDADDLPTPTFRVERFPDGRWRYTYWYRNQPPPRMIDEYVANQRVTLVDDNLDYKPDRRRVQTPFDAGLVEIVDQVDGGSAGWVEVNRYVVDLEREQGTRRDPLCDGNSNFAPEITSAPTAFGFTAQPTVACNPMQKQELMQAFECAKKALFGCMQRNNPTLTAQVIAHLATRKLLVGCNNPCGDTKLGSTTAANDSSSARMNVNYTDYNWSGQFAPKLCSLVLHELNHVGNEGFDSSHDDGLDKTYACSNYCGGCINLGPYGAGRTPPPSMNENCARCAETETERRKCGIKTEKVMGTCVTPRELCHNGLNGNMGCTFCGNIDTLDCLGNRVDAPRFDCCAICPPGFPRNDLECPTGAQTMSTCDMKPPECP